MKIVRTHIKEAFEKIDKTGKNRALLFPGEKLNFVDIENLAYLITDDYELTKEIQDENNNYGHDESKDFKFLINIPPDDIGEMSIRWIDSNGVISKTEEYNKLEGMITGVHTYEPYEEQTLDYPGSPGWDSIDFYLNYVNIINNGEVKMKISNYDTDEFKIINKEIAKSFTINKD